MTFIQFVYDMEGVHMTFIQFVYDMEGVHMTFIQFVYDMEGVHMTFIQFVYDMVTWWLHRHCLLRSKHMLVVKELVRPRPCPDQSDRLRQT